MAVVTRQSYFILQKSAFYVKIFFREISGEPP